MNFLLCAEFGPCERGAVPQTEAEPKFTCRCGKGCGLSAPLALEDGAIKGLLEARILYHGTPVH